MPSRRMVAVARKARAIVLCGEERLELERIVRASRSEQRMVQRARLVLLVGAAAGKIAAQLGDAVPGEWAGTIERAGERAFESARPGDTVLLAPACASFDQFRNYEHRGEVFKQLVHRIESRVAAAG